jgi:hypothetical protein
MVHRNPAKTSLKKCFESDLVLGVSEEVKYFRVYSMDDKSVVNTQHVKYIETLSCAQNFTLLTQIGGSVDGMVDKTGLVTGTAQHCVTPRLRNTYRCAQLTSASHLVDSEIFCLRLSKHSKIKKMKSIITNKQQAVLLKPCMIHPITLLQR